nr:class I SAM-dependent methyltransferase [uncultured Carboxylicivirga sp.]
MEKELFNTKILEIEKSIWEVEGLHKGEYDDQAVQYDRLISNGLYNRLMWGNVPQDYSAFCKKGLEKSNGGIIADIGCGTLSFTYKEYSVHNNDDLYLCDLSYEMLKIGKRRIQKTGLDISNINFLRSDALNLPFKDKMVDTVFSFGLFHIFNNPSSLINEIVRILKPNGKIFLTSLCNDRLLSAKYLSFLHKKGHVAVPLKSTEIKNIVENSGIDISEFIVKGGMTSITGIKKAK